MTLEKKIYTKEYWTGNSRDGNLVDGDGYHYYKMDESGLITEAYEFYELDDGRKVVSSLPEMANVNWIKDLGFEDLEALEQVEVSEFENIRYLNLNPPH
ncbi:MAG: hypothetical protein CMP10_08265 [Zetaproteobacteria bacterium]|nr:hypothetical protein [Pseudobdellovibrionaceae bacterium]|tara:strand:- start:1531 stop:1827 length:297 start_codon:yes stop_codon:yes gene_type:complete